MRKIPRSNEAIKVKSKIILLDELLQQLSVSSHSRGCRWIPQEQTGQSCRGPVTHTCHWSPSVDSPSCVYKGLSAWLGTSLSFDRRLSTSMTDTELDRQYKGKTPSWSRKIGHCHSFSNMCVYDAFCPMQTIEGPYRKY